MDDLGWDNRDFIIQPVIDYEDCWLKSYVEIMRGLLKEAFLGHFLALSSFSLSLKEAPLLLSLSLSLVGVTPSPSLSLSPTLFIILRNRSYSGELYSHFARASTRPVKPLKDRGV